MSPTFTRIVDPDRQEDVDARAEANEAHALALLHAIALLRVGHDAARDQAGDLPHENVIRSASRCRPTSARSARLDSSAAALRNRPGFALDEPNDAAHRISIDVHVEHVHEDRDANGALLHERRLVDVGDHHDLAVGRRDDEPLAALAQPLRIAEEVRDPERDERQREREQPERPRASRERDAERADGDRAPR